MSISGTKVAGKTVTVRFATKISGAATKYQWYVKGKKVKNATKSSLKLAKSQVGKPLSVKVITSWTDAAGTKQSVTATATYLRTACIKR